MSELTPKQERFVDEYLVDMNATQAAIRCGYSEASASVQGSRLYANAKVRARIDAATADRSERTKVTADWVLTNLVNVAERCQQRQPVMTFNRATREMEQVVDDDGNHVWQFDSGGANRSLELIGKHLGMFKDKLEHSGSVDVKARVSVYIPDNGRG